jgi:hypothetical protein
MAVDAAPPEPYFIEEEKLMLCARVLSEKIINSMGSSRTGSIRLLVGLTKFIVSLHLRFEIYIQAGSSFDGLRRINP